jgi:hypothetical protein
MVVESFPHLCNPFICKRVCSPVLGCVVFFSCAICLYGSMATVMV